MKALAAISISDYERAVNALGDYYETIERGMGVCFRVAGLQIEQRARKKPDPPCLILFGTDQGLVGQFNDTLLNFVQTNCPLFRTDVDDSTPNLSAASVWVVGERLHERLIDAGVSTAGYFNVPDCVQAITPLISHILLSIESKLSLTAQTQMHLFYHRPCHGSGYYPISQPLLPLDANWSKTLAQSAWPSSNLPQVLGDPAKTLGALIREYLFVSLFRASAESLASENASRLAAMQRADKNIEELLQNLEQVYNRRRQASIDAEMFDVIAGAMTD